VKRRISPCPTYILPSQREGEDLGRTPTLVVFSLPKERKDSSPNLPSPKGRERTPFQILPLPLGGGGLRWGRGKKEALEIHLWL